MTKALKEKLTQLLKKIPSTKVLFAITSAIILAAIIYIAILFLSSN